jgi:signal transduction histidine kinase
MGLGSMKQRAARLGGELTIESALDQGTRVKVTVPLTPDIITPPDHTEISE